MNHAAAEKITSEIFPGSKVLQRPEMNGQEELPFREATNDSAEAMCFFNCLYQNAPDGFLDLRFKKEGGGAFDEFVNINSPDEIQKIIRRHSDKKVLVRRGASKWEKRNKRGG